MDGARLKIIIPSTLIHTPPVLLHFSEGRRNEIKVCNLSHDLLSNLSQNSILVEQTFKLSVKKFIKLFFYIFFNIVKFKLIEP